MAAGSVSQLCTIIPQILWYTINWVTESYRYAVLQWFCYTTMYQSVCTTKTKNCLHRCGYEIVGQSCIFYNTTSIMHHSLSYWKLWICSTTRNLHAFVYKTTVRCYTVIITKLYLHTASNSTCSETLYCLRLQTVYQFVRTAKPKNCLHSSILIIIPKW